MSEAELRRQIADLERQLAQLRRQLPPAKAWRSPEDDATQKNEADKRGDPFEVLSAEELQLGALPALARQILDALPVKIFVKVTHSDGEKGRKYTYLNDAARRPLGWSEAEVLDKYDSDYFERKDLYQTMHDRETQTIDNQRSLLSVTAWSTTDNAWSKNYNIEIPILTQAGAVGFCSIAHDLVFKEIPGEWGLYIDWVRHNYKNLITALASRFRTAEQFAAELKPGDVVSREFVSGLTQQLKAIEQPLIVASRVSQVQIEAFLALERAQQPAATRQTILTARQIAEKLDTHVYQERGFPFTVQIPGAVADTPVKNPEVVLAVLTVLINNAIKHSPRQQKECRLQALLRDGCVVWQVSNPYPGTLREEQRLRLDFTDQQRQKLEAVRHNGFDGLLIWTLVSRSFAGKIPAEVVVFPTATDQGRICIEFFSEVADDESKN